MKNIGIRIKELRERAKFSQSQVAEYLGLDQSYLSKIESGERSISVEYLEKLAELYGCNLEIFKNSELKVAPIRLAFRAKEVTSEDMEIIAAVNHIASNSRYMAQLLGE